MNVKICFDFHDIFVDAKTAWIESFTNLCNDHKENIVIDYNNKVSKKEICKRYKLKYEEVEEVYRKHLEPINDNIKFAKEIQKHHIIDLISLSRYTRLKKDIEKFSLETLFDKIYSKLDVIDRTDFLQKYSKDANWVIYFNHDESNLKIINKVIYVPIDTNNITTTNDGITISKDKTMIKIDF